MCNCINRCESAKQPGEKWANDDGGEAVPDEKHNNSMLGDWTFPPGDFRVEKVSEDGSEGIRDKAV